MLSYPGLIAGAMIFAIVVVQLRDREYLSLIFIAIFSVPILGLLVFLTYKNLDLLGYILLLIPIILVFVGYRMGMTEPVPAPSPTPELKEEEEKKKCSCIKIPCVCPVAIT